MLLSGYVVGITLISVVIPFIIYLGLPETKYKVNILIPLFVEVFLLDHYFDCNTMIELGVLFCLT